VSLIIVSLFHNRMLEHGISTIRKTVMRVISSNQVVLFHFCLLYAGKLNVDGCRTDCTRASTECSCNMVALA
jgi:hypothetical protein